MAACALDAAQPGPQPGRATHTLQSSESARCTSGTARYPSARITAYDRVAQGLSARCSSRPPRAATEQQAMVKHNPGLRHNEISAFATTTALLQTSPTAPTHTCMMLLVLPKRRSNTLCRLRTCCFCRAALCSNGKRLDGKQNRICTSVEPRVAYARSCAVIGPGSAAHSQR
jgi:hypothetical protein